MEKAIIDRKEKIRKYLKTIGDRGTGWCLVVPDDLRGCLGMNEFVFWHRYEIFGLKKNERVIYYRNTK